MSHLTPLLVAVEMEFDLKGKASWENLKAAVEGSVVANSDDTLRILLGDNLRMKQILSAIAVMIGATESTVTFTESADAPKDPPEAMAMRG